MQQSLNILGTWWFQGGKNGGGRGTEECIRVGKGKERKESGFLPSRHKHSFLFFGEGIFCPLPACKKLFRGRERECAWNPPARSLPEETCRTKALYWTSCHLGPSYFMIGSKPWTKLVTDPLGGGSLLDCGVMSEIRDRDSVVA